MRNFAHVHNHKSDDFTANTRSNLPIFFLIASSGCVTATQPLPHSLPLPLPAPEPPRPTGPWPLAESYPGVVRRTPGVRPLTVWVRRNWFFGLFFLGSQFCFGGWVRSFGVDSQFFIHFIYYYFKILWFLLCIWYCGEFMGNLSYFEVF
jgi:hypothetical protein